MARATAKLYLGILSLEISDVELKRSQGRPRSRTVSATLDGGWCVILSRDTGLALDCTHERGPGTKPVLWGLWAHPIQRWLIRPGRKDGDEVQILTWDGQLALECARPLENGAAIILSTPSDRAEQRWVLRLADDGGAFFIESAAESEDGPYVMDATWEAVELREPIVWQKHGGAWQQWIVARLPFVST